MEILYNEDNSAPRYLLPVLYRSTTNGKQNFINYISDLVRVLSHRVTLKIDSENYVRRLMYIGFICLTFFNQMFGRVLSLSARLEGNECLTAVI